MTFFDTHVHFDGLADSANPAAVLDRAAQAGVVRMLAVGGSPEGNRHALSTAATFPTRLRAAVGYDRYRADAADSPAELRPCLARPSNVVAVGEIGLDLYHAPDTAAAQQRLFTAMLTLAREYGLPVIVHSREADAQTLALLRDHVRAWPGAADRVGVLHCFTGGAALAGEILDLGFHLSFSGILTFRNAGPLREVARAVPIERLLIETDAPYLAPVPHRGQKNEPALLPHIAGVLADLHEKPVAEIAAITTQNANRLFDWS